MNKQYRTWLTVGAIAIFVFIFLDPFGLNQPNLQTARPSLTEELAAQISTELNRQAQSTDAVIAGELATSDVVFFAEMGYIAEEVNFIRDNFALLYSNGVRLFGFPYGRAQDQDIADQLMANERFSRSTARSILFNRRWFQSFEEYVDLLESLHSFNQEHQSDPIRLILLDATLYFEALKNEEDVSDLEVQRQVYRNGTPDEVIANSIIGAGPDWDNKMAVLLERPYALRSHTPQAYIDSARELGAPLVRAAAIVDRDLGGRTSTIFFHSPWPFSQSNTSIIHPADGMFEQFAEERAESNQLPVAFEIADLPTVGRQALQFSDLAQDAEISLSSLADAYIILKPINQLTASRPVIGMVTEENKMQAIAAFPGNIDENTSVDDMNGHLARTSEAVQQYLENFE